MATFKNSMSYKVRAFLKLHPKAKPSTVAKELGIQPSVVHSTMWRDKKFGAPKRRYTKKKQEWNWDTVAVVSSDTPFESRLIEMPITMAEPEVEAPKVEVDMVNSPPHYKVGGIEVIDFIEAIMGPRTEAMVTGGWAHDPMVAAAKRAQLGDYATSTLTEPAAMGAAFFGGIAAGLLERPGPEELPRWR